MRDRLLLSDWLRYALGVMVAAAAAYFTTTGAIQSEIATIKARQDSQFGEVLRRMDDLKADIRELRRGTR